MACRRLLTPADALVTPADACRRLPNACRRLLTSADACRRLLTPADACRRLLTLLTPADVLTPLLAQGSAVPVSPQGAEGGAARATRRVGPAANLTPQSDLPLVRRQSEADPTLWGRRATER
jgi:hypothetical protein